MLSSSQLELCLKSSSVAMQSWESLVHKPLKLAKRQIVCSNEIMKFVRSHATSISRCDNFYWTNLVDMFRYKPLDAALRSWISKMLCLTRSYWLENWISIGVEGHWFVKKHLFCWPCGVIILSASSAVTMLL